MIAWAVYGAAVSGASFLLTMLAIGAIHRTWYGR